VTTTATQSPIDDPSEWLRRSDGWFNPVTGLGTGRDKSAVHDLQLELVPPDVSERFLRADGLAARVVTILPGDALAGGHEVSITGPDGRADRALAELLEHRRQCLDAADPRQLDLPSAEHRLLVLARGLGGAALLPLSDDARPLSEPATPGAQLTGYDVLDLRELTPLEYDSATGSVAVWLVQRRTEFGASVPVVAVHASRLIRAHGATSVEAPRSGTVMPGWPGDSIYTSCVEHLRRYCGSIAGAGALLADFAQMIYRIKGLASTRGRDDMMQLLIARMRLIDVSRSMVRGIALDADSESAERVTTPLTGFSEATDRIALALSAATGIPATRLLGRAPDGMNATGASDTANYHALVIDYRTQKVEPLHRAIYTRLLRERGLDPARHVVQIQYAALSTPSELERQQARLLVAQRDAIDITNQVVTPEEVARSRYGGDGYSPETTIEVDLEGGADTESEPLPGDRLADAGQITALTATIAQVNAGTLTWAQGLEVLLQVFGLAEVDALRMLGPQTESPVSPPQEPDLVDEVS
jgi:uncharacterized protein